MPNTSPEFSYTEQHEWVRPNDDGTLTIGITDYAQNSLGDITFVELPNVGAQLQKDEVFGVVESVKAASDLYVPLSGELLEVNTKLEETPEILNKDPYEKGWILRIQPANPADFDKLLSLDEYQALLGA